MATLTTCDGCGLKVHTDAREIKFRVDLYETGLGKHGYDLCGECFAKVTAVVPQFGTETQEERVERAEVWNARQAAIDGVEITYTNG